MFELLGISLVLAALLSINAVASMLAVKFVGSPWHVTLGALAGMAVALVMPPRPIAEADLAEAERLEEGDL